LQYECFLQLSCKRLDLNHIHNSHAILFGIAHCIGLLMPLHVVNLMCSVVVGCHLFAHVVRRQCVMFI